MYQIEIVENPFNPKEPAWRDIFGRVAIRVKGEDTVHWYYIWDNKPLLDEVTMVISEPFHGDAGCHYLVN